MSAGRLLGLNKAKGRRRMTGVRRALGGFKTCTMGGSRLQRDRERPLDRASLLCNLRNLHGNRKKGTPKKASAPLC